MHQYGVRDVEKLLRLPRSTIRSLINAGFVKPSRGPRNAWLFSFQDLIVLRTAQALVAAHVPGRRITRAVKELRRNLPASMPLSGLNIGAVANRVVVKEGGSQWQAESGQYLLAFEGDPADGSLSVIERSAPPAANDAQEWFERGVFMEQLDLETAIVAYQRAVDADASRMDARINLGRLLHEAGRLAKAERVYREAIRLLGSDPVALFNLGVVLDDMNRKREAVDAYEAALRRDPALADCHYNLALVYGELGRPRESLRHMSQYRRLGGSGT